MSYQNASSMLIQTPKLKISSVTEVFRRRLELLSASINHIAQKIASDKDLTRNPSRKACEGAYATGPLMSSITRSMKRNGKGI